MKESLLNVAHDMAQDLYEVGAIDLMTMHRFDKACLPKVQKMQAEDIKILRLKERLSQAVFAHYLNVSESTVRQWEQGKKSPGGAALKLLHLIKAHGLSILMV